MRPTSHLASLALAAIATPVLADDIAITTVDESPPPSRYPRAVIARPLTLPARLVMLGADATSNRDLSAMGGAPIIGAGITDELDVQIPYAFATRDLEGEGTLAVDVGYAVVRGALGGKLEIVARARGGHDFLADTALPLAIGAHVQYNATDWLAIISGVPGAQQLQLALVDAHTSAAGLPLGIGVQPTGELYIQLDTRIAQVALADGTTSWIGRDVTPISLTAVYNVIPPLDVQAAVATDLDDAREALMFLVGARYYAGRF